MPDSGADAGVSGVFEDVKGKAKEVAGNVTDDDRLREEGKAQQDKARADRDVAEHEGKAEAARAKSEAHEAKERAAQTDT
jgi:uncharacterized protein YjbJ (UPF0337 family)